MEPATYEIVRFHMSGRQRVMRTNLTRAEAQAHCQDPATRGADWFDGFRNTDPAYQRAMAERDIRQFKAIISSGLATPKSHPRLPLGHPDRAPLPACED